MQAANTYFTLSAPRPGEESGTVRPSGGFSADALAASHAFALTSVSFANGVRIPDRLALEEGVSPQLSWSDAPDRTSRFVIIMDDPDAQPVVHHTFVHWVVCVPSHVSSIPEGASSGGWSGRSKPFPGDGTNTAYRGPKPPPLSGVHHYFIKIYAVADTFDNAEFNDLARSAAANDTRTYTRAYFESAFAAHILGSSEIMGTYGSGRPS
jgi:Raf kinase inhibitor-like YbhB/YbcL family protein